MIKSRKAVFGLGPVQTVGLVLAFLVIVLWAGPALGKILGVISGGADPGTVNIYNTIVKSIEVMMNPANTNDTCIIRNGYIEPNFAIVGFNKDGVKNVAGETGDKEKANWGYVEEHCGIWDDDIYKPKKCLTLACLCLCNGNKGDVSGNDCIEDNPKCIPAPKDLARLWLGPFDNHKDLVLYGENCLGTDNNIIAGYVLKKLYSGIEGETTIMIEQVMTKQEMEQYADKPECEKLAASFKRGIPKKEEKEQEQKTDRVLIQTVPEIEIEKGDG